MNMNFKIMLCKYFKREPPNKTLIITTGSMFFGLKEIFRVTFLV